MAGQDVAAVFHTQCALEETLHQVAPGAEEHHDESQTYPSGNAEGMNRTFGVGDIADDAGNNQYEDATADTAFPTLARTDAGEELVLA